MARARMEREEPFAGSSPNVDVGKVAEVAYGLYVQRGREDGHDLEDWLKAEEIVRQRRSSKRGTLLV